LILYTVGTLKVQENPRVSTKHYCDVLSIAGSAPSDAGSKCIAECSQRRGEREATIEQTVPTEDAPLVGGLTRQKRVLPLNGNGGQPPKMEDK